VVLVTGWEKSMFKSARLKLTLWYLLIIAFISISFSGVIYRSLTYELDRVEQMQRSRVDRIYILNDDAIRPPYLDPQLITETKDRIKLTLLFINLAIIGGSTVAGYFLAGRTLNPIEDMVEEQKRFVSDASHELRTPLTALKTEIEVALRDKKLNLSDSKSLLKSNLEEVDKMQKLSNYLLTLNHYQGNSNQVSLKKVNLKDVVEKSVTTLAPLAKKKEILITTKLNPVYVHSNEEALVELTKILLDNAIKYTHEKGKISLMIKKEGSKAILQVHDNGIGIRATEIPYIFNRFYRADLSRAKNKIEGFGLGLSIAKNIVDLHRGKVSVASVPQKGTTFTITFPAESAKA
jgi:two-component system, OmpR family, sensor histidine kinase CiaH